LITLPETADAFRDATWDDVAPYYDELASRHLDRGNVEAWLADWSHFESLLTEAGALTHFAYSCDTGDKGRERAWLRFSSEIRPQAEQARSRLRSRLVELGYVRPGIEVMVQKFRNQLELFRAENVPLFAELAQVSTEWSRAVGAMTVDWDG